jgi:hypothetical protein
LRQQQQQAQHLQQQQQLQQLAYTLGMQQQGANAHTMGRSHTPTHQSAASFGNPNSSEAQAALAALQISAARNFAAQQMARRGGSNPTSRGSSSHDR